MLGPACRVQAARVAAAAAGGHRTGAAGLRGVEPHVQPGGGAARRGPGFYQVTDLVDKPDPEAMLKRCIRSWAKASG